MMRRVLRRGLIGAVAAMTVVGVTATGASAAVRPFDPPVVVVGGSGTGLGDAVVTSIGSVRGFADISSSTGPRIRFFSRAADGTVRPSEATGFNGTVLGVAYDSTGTYVLFYTGSSIVIGKRTNAGEYTSRIVDSWGGVVAPTGDVIARSGQWFGVWSKQVGPGGEFAQTELFQGGTAYPARRITATAANLDDGEPSLAYTNGTVPLLVWTRLQNPAAPGPSDLRVAKFLGGSWQSRVFAQAGTSNYSPDVQVVSGLTFVTWGRDGHVVVASNRFGTFSSRTFAVPGVMPNVAASTLGGVVDHVFVAWTVPGDSDAANRVFFAETASDGLVMGVPWEGAYLTGNGAAAFAVGAYAGKATVAYRTFTAVWLRSQS